MSKASSDKTVTILRYMRGHPGQPKRYEDIAAELGLDKETVNAALARTVRLHPEEGMRREASGTYVFRADQVGKAAPEPVRKDKHDDPKPGDLLEVVGRSSDGTIVVRDAISSVLYALRPI